MAVRITCVGGVREHDETTRNATNEATTMRRRGKLAVGAACSVFNATTNLQFGGCSVTGGV